MGRVEIIEINLNKYTIFSFFSSFFSLSRCHIIDYELCDNSLELAPPKGASVLGNFMLVHFGLFVLCFNKRK